MKKLEALAYEPYGPHLIECLNLELFLLPGVEINTTGVVVMHLSQCHKLHLLRGLIKIIQCYYYLPLLLATSI